MDSRRVGWRGWTGRGQLVIPALFVLPSLMLFLYLIFETAKVSREKIRHQFAVDSAAFIEMANYSDLVNRLAYINGAFPMRVFRESWPMHMKVESSANSAPEAMLKMLYENGVFPDADISSAADPDLTGAKLWSIRYSGSQIGERLNSNEPGDTTGVGPMGTQHVFTQKQAERYWLWYEHHSVQLWQFFSQVWTLFGSVADAQVTVYKRLSGNNAFFKKSWMLNTGLPSGSADASAFDGKALNPRCIASSKSGTYGRFRKNEWWDPYGTQGFGDDPDAQGGSKAYDHAGTSFCPEGLFRVAVVDRGSLQRVKLDSVSSGVEIKQRWTAPDNYFMVNLNSPRPIVHARVGLLGCCVWAEEGSPMPTPKFQTRLLP